MAITNFYEEAVSRLAAQADAVGSLAHDSGGFAAVVAAFASEDPAAFRWVLERLNLLPRCELICEWVAIKLSVLRCIEVCGVLPENAGTPDLAEFARAIMRLASRETQLRRIVDAVSCGDAADYHAVIDELGLREFCHLLCQWIVSILYERVCELVCVPGSVVPADPVTEIHAAARSLAALTGHQQAFTAIAGAAERLDCKTLTAAIAAADQIANCEIICRVICTWRRVWVCREICEGPVEVLTGTLAVQEAQKFALALRQLANQPRVLSDLVTAVQSRDAKTYGAIVARYGLVAYCHQVCAWVTSVTCTEFCSCVCPPAGISPWFTSIGTLDYDTQIDSALPATGLTVGATQAFFSTLRLNGFLTQTLGGQPLEYCFEYVPVNPAATTITANIGAADVSLTVASSAGFPATPFIAVIGSANGAYEIITITGVAGATWTVARGQQGTTAAAANAGASVVTGAAASGSWTQVPTNWIARTIVGTEEVLVPLPLPHFEPAYYTVNGNSPDINVPFTPDGWIPVPQGSSIQVDGYYLINLDSTKLAAFTPADETGVSAGNPANHPLPADLYFGLRMRVRQHGSTTSTVAGTCNVVAIDNTIYDNQTHHPEWAGFTDNAAAVYLVDIKELDLFTTLANPIASSTQTSITVASSSGFPTSGTFNVLIGSEILTVTAVAGTTWTVLRGQEGTTAATAPAGATVYPAFCTSITDSLTVLFTATHPNLGPVSVSMKGGPTTPPHFGQFPFTLPAPAETGDWYGVAVPSGWTLADLVPCAYVVTLTVPVLLTTGDTDFSPPLTDQIGFCLT
jgi:hypothetical protein